MPKTTNTKWYNELWVVALLCFFFFPIGLLALWWNKQIAREWKLATTLTFAMLAGLALYRIYTRPVDRKSVPPLPRKGVSVGHTVRRISQRTSVSSDIDRVRLINWRLLLAGLFLLALEYGQAQSYRIDYTREGAWRYTHQPETAYLQNGRIIDHQLTGIGNRLNQLSVVDPPVYSIVQSELHAYLYRLERQNPDYGNTAIYNAVLLRLMAIEETVNSALAKGRQRAMANPADGPLIEIHPEELRPGETLQLRPYAILFQRASYRSKVVHIVSSHETVRLLRRNDAYQYVQCGTYRGYLGTGMIIGSLPLP